MIPTLLSKNLSLLATAENTPLGNPKKNTTGLKTLLALFTMLVGTQVSWGQLTLPTSPYTQNFDAIGTTQPTGWSVYTGATASALGTIATFPTTTVSWATSTGQFINAASLNAGLATTASAATQTAATERALGLRQTASYGNPGGAFVLQLANTTGRTSFTFSFKIMNLDPTLTTGRTSTWNVDYGFGTTPTSFTNATTSPASVTIVQGAGQSTATVTVNFGNALDNQSGNVWIRIVTKSAASGSGTSPGIGIDDISLAYTTASATNYYSKSTGNLNDVANWGTNTDGTGTAPTNFTTANQVFNIRNNATPTIGAAWTVSGSGSKIIVGDATNACNFTIPALYAVTGTIDVSAGATLTNSNTATPTLGTLNATSTVEFNAVAAQTVPAATYGNLKVNTTTANATAGGAIVLAATTTLTVENGSVFDLGANALTGGATSFTTSGTGTIKTQNTSATPLPTGKTWTMDVEYNGTGAQTIVTGTYNNVTLSTARTSSPAITLGSGTITIGNIFSVTATGVGSYVNTGNTVDFSKATTQTIPAINYLNITNTGNGVRTLANGVIKIASTFTPGSSNYTIGTSTVEFNGSSPQTIPVLPVASGGNYYNLTYSGNSIGTLGGSITVAGNFVQSAGNFQITSTSSASAVTLNVTGNVTLSNAAILNLLNSTINGASATLNVTGNTTTSGATSIFFETVNNSNASGIALFQTNDFTTTSTVSNIIDFGISTVLGNEFRISGNFSKSGNGKFLTSSSSASTGFVFNKSGTQTFSYSGANSSNTQYVVNSGSTLQLLTSLTMGAFTNPTSTFTVNGTLDMGINVISGTTNPTFTLGATGAIITSNTGGLVTAITTPGTNVFTAGASYTFNGATTTPFHSATLGAPANVIINANVTLNKSTTITNSLSLTSGTLTVGANTLTLSGSTINRDGTTYTGNIDASNASATVAFTNTSALTIPASTFTGTCKNITLNGAGGITLSSDLTIGGTLTFTSGKITTGANKVILTSAGTVSRTSGYVVGNLQKNVAVSATSRTFEIGDDSNYTPITLALTSVTGAGDLTASTTIPGAAPASASGIHPTKYLNRYWTLTNSGITLSSFDPTFTFVAGDIQGSATTSSFVGAKLTSSAWTNPTVGTLTSTSSQLTGVTSFGDFYLGQPGTPSVTSLAANSITTTGAVLNGTVNDNGSTTSPGFDYGTSTSYGSTGTTSPSNIASGTGATSVTSTISSLSVNTQYNFRANATNSLGTSNGSNLTFYTLANLPGTPTVTNPTNTSLDVLIDVNSNPSNTQFAIQETGGNYVQANGSLGVSAVWQTASVWGTKTVTGLSGGTLYTFQVIARNGDNTATSFGTSANGTTSSSVVPTISTPTATAILSTTATLGGNVTSDGGATITARGVVWAETSLNNAPQLSGSNVTNVTGTGTTGVFTTAATSLPSATQISYSAYATNSQGTSYTTPTTFYTLATEPNTQATSLVFSSQTASSLNVSWTNGNGGRRAVFMKAAAGSITNPIDANAYTASSDWNNKGTQLGTSGYYCIYDGTGSTVTVTNLADATAYYVQVFDYNSDVTPTAATINYYTATATGNPGNSITLSSDLSAHAASFTAVAASTISLTLSFSAASTITNATGYIILQKSGSSAPTGTPTNATSYSIGNTIGDGTIAAIITNTATTSTTISGLAYASSYSFTLIPFNWNTVNTGTYNYYNAATIPSATGTTSTPTAPIISTPTSASVTTTTATLGGNVTSDGGDPTISERGIVWSETSLNADPIIGGSNVTKVAGTGTTGIYTVATTGLTSGVSISYKAYATNSTGTSYTTVGTFTTLAVQPTTQASNITFANVGMNSMTINWTNGNGTNRMVVVKASGAPGTPSDGQTYTANTIFGSGSNFGTSEYVVYIGANNTVDITGLTASITYSVKVFEYNGNGASVNYLTTSNNTSQTTAALTYYTNGSGDPALLASWNSSRNGTGSNPTNFTSGESFVIESGDVMNTTSTWAISGTNSRLQIESGGTLTANHAITLAAATTFQIDNGGTYIHNNNGSLTSTIFLGTEVFGASSNFIINNTPTFTAPSAPGYGNLTINTSTNATSVGLSSTLTQVQGNLTITSTGTGLIRYALTSTTSTSLNVGGNLVLNGTSALFYLSSGSGGTASVTIAGDVIVSAGTLDMSNSASGGAGTLNIGGNFNQTGGIIKSTSSTPSTINFTGSGKTFTQSAGTLTNTNINWTIADGASLTLNNDLPVATSRTLTVGGGTSGIIDCSSLAVSGAGTFTLSAGATLKTASSTGVAGSITTTSKSFSSAANYEFNGAATGTFTTTPTANTVNNLTINRSAGVALSQSIAVAGTLSHTSGKFALGAYTLTLNSGYSGSAANSLVGSASSNLTTTGTTGTLYFDQTTQGTTNVLKNLTLSSGSATLGNALNITAGSSSGTVTVGSGASLATGGFLTLKSDALGTASVGNSAGTITGNVTVERYIPAKRAWRALTAPLVGSTNSSVYYNWQNNGTTIANTGVEIWSNASTDASVTNAGLSSSLLSYNSSSNTWTAITNTISASLFSSSMNNPFMVFVTGPYASTSTNITNLNTFATTLKATGTLLTGNQTYATTAGKYNFIGNPYASPLDLSVMMNNTQNTTASFGGNVWVWDANASGLNAVGTYNLYTSGTYTNLTSNPVVTAGTQIQSGQAFFVKSTDGAPFTIKESHKGSAFSNAVFKTGTLPELLRVGLYKQVNNEWSGRDGAMTVILADADANQASNKMANGTENIAFTKNGASFASNHQLPLVASDVLNVKVWNTTVGANYKLKINTEEFSATNLEATLEDLFTNVRTPLTLDGTAVEYPFTVTADAMSTGNRFRIVFQTSALGTTIPKANGFSIVPNPVTGDSFQVNLGSLGTGTYSYSICNTIGQEVEKGSIDTTSQNTNYTIKMNNSATGIYIMKIKGSDNSVFTAKIIKK